MQTQQVSNTLQTRYAKSRQLVADGTRFLKDGHWWEVDDHISGKAGPYYRCHPVCNIESRFFQHAEVSEALNDEHRAVRMNVKSQSGPTKCGSVDRGSGRIADVIPISRGGVTLKSKSSVKKGCTGSPCKILAIGSRQDIQQTIQDLHNLGFAHPSDWSPLQKKPRSNEFMSIFTGHKF
jgi:hypothetical protein